MRALERIVKHNINTSVQIIRSNPLSKDDSIAELLARIMTIHGGYADTLTPNGVLRKDDLDQLLSIDSEISMCLGMLESGNSRAKAGDVAATLKELMEERKKLVGSLKA
jgi:hypothetical protein